MLGYGTMQLSRDIFLRRGPIPLGFVVNLFVRLLVPFEYWLWYGFAMAELAGIAIIRTLGGRYYCWESLASVLCNWPLVSGDDLCRDGMPFAWRTLGYPWVFEIIGLCPSIFGLRNKLSSDVVSGGGGLCSEETYLRRSGSASPMPTGIAPAGWRWCWLQYCAA